ncbi:MAG: hypothetical protein ABIK89_10565, partial [Planctomycetota bacterium]
MRPLGHHHSPLAVLESGEQADLSLPAADLVPGEPKAVGMPHFRLAVVACQLLGQKDILLLRRGRVWIRVFIIEGVDGERAVDDDRLVFLLGVE